MRWQLGVLALAGSVLLVAPRTSALPLFSRSLGAPCATCHDVVPRLNAVGLAFAEHGYRLDGHAAPTGSNGVPLSVVGSAGLVGSHLAPERASASVPSERVSRGFSSLELVAAGAPAPWLAYHVDAGLARTGVDRGEGEDFVRLRDAFPEGELALRAGRFDAELPCLSSGRRLTRIAYLSPVAFDARGLELDRMRSDWTAAAGLSLSERTRAGGASARTVQPPLEDTYIRLSRRLGAQSFGAQMLFDRQDSNLPTLSWLQHLRCQVAANLEGPGFTLVPSYIFDRFDDRPAPGIHERHEYYLLEGIVPFGLRSHWVMTGRYEHDYRTRNTYDPEQHRQRGVLQVAWQASANARIAVEGSRTDDRLARQGRAGVEAFAQASW